MSISVTCECGKQLRVKDELAGKRVKCPGCGKVFPTPGPLPAPVAAPPEKPQKLTESFTIRCLWPWFAGGGAMLVMVGMAIWFLAGTRKQPEPEGSVQAAPEKFAPNLDAKFVPPAEPKSPNKTTPLPGPKGSELPPFAGEWTGLGHHLHLDQDGFGYGLVKLLFTHTEELHIRKADGKWVMDFPEEVNFGPGKHQFRKKPMTVQLDAAGTLNLYDSAGMLWYRLKKRSEFRQTPAAADFAGEWKVWSVSVDGMGFKQARELMLKLKTLNLSLSPNGTGTVRFVTDKTEPTPPVQVKFQDVGHQFVLRGLEGKEWEIKFFYIAEKQRLIRLRTKDAAVRVFTYAHKVD